MIDATIPRPDVAAWALHEARVRAARTFVEACDAEGIPVLPVKGIVTAHTLYRDPVERPMFDVDFRARLVDHPRLTALIRRHGWQLREMSRVYSNHTFTIEGVEVDAECHVGPPHVCALSVDQMLARAQRSRVLGFETLLPQFDDHVALLVVNAFKDKLEHARPWAIRDLMKVGAHDAFHSAAVVRRLREVRLSTIGWLVADWLVEEHGATSWDSVRTALNDGRGPAFRQVSRFIRKTPAGLLARAATRVVTDRPADGIRALFTALRWELERHRTL